MRGADHVGLAAEAVGYCLDLPAIEVVGEVPDVAGFRTPEPVNALVVVPHDEQARRVRPRQQLDQFKLRAVDVLVFVHQQVRGLLLPGFPHVVVFSK